MTGKADFTAEEWDAIAEGPTSAGMIVSTAERGGTFRETFAMAKAYTEARKEHGDSALLDELVSSKPKMDHTRTHSAEELREHALQRVGMRSGCSSRRRRPRRSRTTGASSISLANRVAGAKTEKGDQSAGDAESAAIAEITEALGSH